MPGTTPVYGFPYPEPTDLVADYPALGQDLAEDIEAVLPTIGGLAPSAPTSIANSAGTATLSGNTVTFSAVNSVSLNSCFTASFDNYFVFYNLTSLTNTAQLRVRYRAAGTDASGASTYMWGYGYLDTGAQGWEAGSTTDTQLNLLTTGAGARAGGTMTIWRPAIAAVTHSLHDGWGFSTIPIKRHGPGYHSVASAYDGFTMFASTGTITGTVSVYGFKK